MRGLCGLFGELGAVPQGIEGGQVAGAQVDALLHGELFDLLEPAPETKKI